MEPVYAYAARDGILHGVSRISAPTDLSLGLPECFFCDGKPVIARPTDESKICYVIEDEIIAKPRAVTHDEVVPRLCRRDEMIIFAIDEGRRSEDIAEMLGIRKKTVDWHRCRLKKKLRVRNDAELIRFAVRHGLVAPGW